MKKTIKNAMLIIAAFAVTELSAQKIGYVALDSLVSSMPESKKAQDIAQDYLKSLEKEVTTMQTEFQNKYNDYLANEATYSDLLKKTKQEELQSLKDRIDQFQQSAQQDYQRKNAELSKPLYDKAFKALEAVAKEGGYKYIMDSSAGILLYKEPGDDVLVAAKKKLATMPAAVLPESKAANTPAPATPAPTKPVKTGK
jgi:outer membrane protein